MLTDVILKHQNPMAVICDYGIFHLFIYLSVVIALVLIILYASELKSLFIAKSFCKLYLVVDDDMQIVLTS